MTAVTCYARCVSIGSSAAMKLYKMGSTAEKKIGLSPAPPQCRKFQYAALDFAGSMGCMSVLTETTIKDTARIRRERVAPWQHTALIVGVLLLWALYGALRAKIGMVSDTPRWMRYSGQVLILWLMTGTTIAGLYRRRRFIRGLLGRVDLRRDLGAGTLVFVGGIAVLAVVGVALRPLHLTQLRDVVTALAPRTSTELALWMLVSASAGLCEEFIFRGYLLRQMLSWSGSRVTAVVVTSILFGGMHLYEGTAAAIQIGALGALFATVAVKRGTLRQVIIAHFVQDALAGLGLFLRHS